MIIDCHGHVSAPAELWAYKARCMSHRGAHGKGNVEVSDDEIRRAVNKKEMAPKGHLDMLKTVGIDLQLISPRPFQMMPSAKPGKVVHWFIEETNNIIHRQTQLFPGLFVGVAGLPQAAGEPIENTLPELERCVKQLGFKGCLLNPDPYEYGGDRGAGARRSLLVSAVREAVRARRPGPHPRHRVAVGALALHAALRERGNHRGLQPGQLHRVQGLPRAQDRRVARRRRDPLPARALRRSIGAPARRRALPRRDAQALLRHGALYRGRAAPAHRDASARSAACTAASARASAPRSTRTPAAPSTTSGRSSTASNG